MGTHFETWNYGVLGPVTLNGLNEGKRDLSLQKWSYKVHLILICVFSSFYTSICREVTWCFPIQVGVIGEALQLHSPTGSSSVEWGSSTSKIQPFTWYKVREAYLMSFMKVHALLIIVILPNCFV